jgi:hypothetical protein
LHTLEPVSAASLLAHAGHSHDGGGPGYEWISYAVIGFAVIYAAFLIVTKRRR